jgi:hypothetical protein
MGLTYHRGIGLGQSGARGVCLLLRSVEGSFGDPKAGLKLTILLSCLGITVLGYLPPPKEMPGIIAIIRIGGV